MLFVGNSYTGRGDLHEVTHDLVLQVDPTADGFPWAALVHDGWAWVDHLGETEVDGSTWQLALVSPEAPWGLVVLQEQSQIPGFPQGESTWQDSLEAGRGLDALIAAQGDGTVLLQTWGRRDGDDENPSLYPDYGTMQDALSSGYAAYADALSTPERPVAIAPAGEGFRIVHDDLVAAGSDPLDGASPFVALYADDGSHPSAYGTLLAACTVMSTTTGARCAGLEVVDPLDPALVEIVQDAADRAVFGDAPDTTPSGTIDVTQPAADADDTASTGCACSFAPAPSAGLILVLVAFAVGRRRGGSPSPG